jgi:hypothetical protein
LPGIYGGGVRWGDYNNDGRLDILLHEDLGSRRVAEIYRNDSGGVFTPIHAALQNFGGRAGWVDFDNDGDLDVWSGATGGFYGSALIFYRNDGGDRFSGVNPGLPWLSFVRSDWGDCDNDGDLDLLLSGRQPDGIWVTRVYRNDGEGGFVDLNAGLPSQFSQAAWADFDGDGWLDFALTGNPGSTRLYRNDGLGGFALVGPVMPDVTVSQGTLAWADYDNDGRPDLLIAGHSSNGRSSKLFQKTGDFAFPELPLGLSPAGDAYCAFADVDRDGDLDLLINGGPAGVVPLHTNHFGVFNTPPTAPHSLEATPSTSGSVILRWRPSMDAQSGPRHLTYNLRVGTTPGGEQMVSPQADLATGLRRVAAPGNAGITNHWRLHLPPGSYFWSVQAVDAGFAGSPFSSEASFTVTHVPPKAREQTVTFLEDTPYELLLGALEPNHQVLTFAIATPPAHGVLLGVPPNLVYVSDTNFFGSDRFTFTVSDGLATSAPGTITLNILPQPDVASARLSAAREAGGLRLLLQGEPYRHYRLEVSDDLLRWDERAMLQPAGDTTAVFLESHVGGAKQFYRARLLDP